MKKIFIAVIFFTFFISLPKNLLCHLDPWWGITIEDVDDYTIYPKLIEIKNSINQLYCPRCTRIVFHPDESSTYSPNPEDFNYVVPYLSTTASTKIMGLVLDSYYWEWPSWTCDEENMGYSFGHDEVMTRVNGFIADDALWNSVDIWEVGNEVNAPWVYEGQIYNVRQTVYDALKTVRLYSPPSKSHQTAITLYYYPDIECVDDCDGPNPYENREYMMQTWAQNLVNEHPDVIYYVDYVFVSYYKDAHYWCDDGSQIDWQTVFTDLSNLFPYSAVGFGEVGWSDEENEPEPNEKIAIINEFYGYENDSWGLPFKRACFYWNFQTDCTPNFETNPVWLSINSLMSNYCPFDNPVFVNENSIATSFSLSQNYPNPFNPSTTIKFQIPEQDYVTLKVYNVLGKEISSLVNNELKNPGKYEVEFDGSNLPSGIYFYTIRTSNFFLSHKMLLIK